jgi:hypothetical protein
MKTTKKIELGGAEFRSEHLQKRSLGRYRQTNPFSKFATLLKHLGTAEIPLNK